MISGPNASVSRWATPAVGSSRQSTRGVEREQAGELDDAAGAGREVGDELVGVAAEAEEVDELVGLGALLAARGGRRRARKSAVGEQPGAAAAPRARAATVSRTVSSGNSGAAWNVRPSPSRARRRRASAGDVVAEQLDRARRRARTRRWRS